MSYANGYNDGYKKGYDDGYSKQRKSDTGGFGIWEVARSCVSPQAYVDTFISGYTKGFDDGIYIYNQELSIKKRIEMIMHT